MTRNSIQTFGGIAVAVAGVAAALLVAGTARGAGPWFVSPTGNDANDCLTPGTACLTINAAIGKASPGDTINVAVGTYVENVILNKDVTLNGAQAGVDARGRIASESIIAPTTGIGIELETGVAGATIDGFTISGGARGIESDNGPLDGLAIQNNRIILFTNAGLFLNDNGSDLTVDKNEIDATAKLGGGGVVHLDTDAFDGFWFTNNNVVNGTTGTGLFSDGNRNVGTSGTRSPKMSGNLIQSNGTGVNLGSRSWEFADISSNIFKNNVFDGLQGGMATSTITSNTFDNNGRSGLAFTSFGNMTAGRGAFANTVTLNQFVGNDTEAVFLSSTQPAGTQATNAINRNSIAGNAFGLRYAGAETINAECNWWGNANGPSGTGPGSGDSVGASATIDFTPWLTTSNLATDPCTGQPASCATPSAPVTQNFTTPGTTSFTVPVYCTLEAKVWGAGGGGGGAANDNGSGGGGGGYTTKTYASGALTPGSNVPVTVGAGGSGGTGEGNPFGTAGGSSSFNTTLSATGGGRGAGQCPGDGCPGGAGGSGSGGDTNLTGQAGANSTSQVAGKGGNGANGGAGGARATESSFAGAGAPQGGGGGGGYEQGNKKPGAAGARGQVTVIYTTPGI